MYWVLVKAYYETIYLLFTTSLLQKQNSSFNAIVLCEYTGRVLCAKCTLQVPFQTCRKQFSEWKRLRMINH